MNLPREILQRVGRVLGYHQGSKLTFDDFHQPTPVVDPPTRPSPDRIFLDHPRTPLPTRLLDAPAGTLAVMEASLEALPESWVAPPQDLKTLASWLHMAAGRIQVQEGGQINWRRACPSGGAAYPCEIYVAAFGVRDLDPGLYHFSPREFSLRKLREGSETLTQIKRGRPDLEFLKTAPAAILVSTIFCRTAWQDGERAYRTALLDAGHLVQNLVTAGSGLGIQTIARLRVHDGSMRELIGLPPDMPFGDAEAVQSMVVWAERATNPLAMPNRPAEERRGGEGETWGGGDGESGSERPSPFAMPGGEAKANSIFDAGTFTGRDLQTASIAPSFRTRQFATLPLIARQPLSEHIKPSAGIMAAHEDCVAPGIAVRDVRPPLTEFNPLPPTVPARKFPISEQPTGVATVRQALLGRRTPTNFNRTAISRAPFLTACRLAFRGGSHFPLFPAGPHVALVRPFWIVNAVMGLDSGIWYYHPPDDTWSLLRAGDFRLESQYLTREQEFCANASAICLMTANLGTLMRQAGPDIYRLAFVEAGMIGQRLALAAVALHLAAAGIGAFYDDEMRQFLGLDQTGWEVVYASAIGVG